MDTIESLKLHSPLLIKIFKNVLSVSEHKIQHEHNKACGMTS